MATAAANDFRVDTSRERNERLANLEIDFISASEFDGFEYTQAELDRVDELVSEVATRPRVGRESSAVGTLLAAALPPLSASDERILFRRMNFVRSRAEAVRIGVSGRRRESESVQMIASLLNEAESIRRRLAESYVRLVVAVARKFSRQSQNFQDLVGEGMLILLSAIDKFDYSRGFRFSTYLTHSLQRQFSRVLQRMQRIDARFILTPDNMLAESAPADEVEYVETPPNLAVHQLMDAARERLEEREQSILHRRYGTGNQSKPQTLRQVAADLGMSKERVRQIQCRALSKLKGLAMELKLASAVS